MKKYKTFLTYRFVSFVILPILFTFVLSSCAYQQKPLVPEERLFFHNDIHSAVVVPFVNVTGMSGDIDNTTEIFASELGRFREVQIVHPSSVWRFLSENNIILSEKNLVQRARMIGDFFNVDAVVVGTITEYKEYFPPILGLSIMIIGTENGEVIASKSEVYDSSFNYIRNELKEYASVKRVSDSMFGEDMIMHKLDLYIRFVCYEIIRKYF